MSYILKHVLLLFLFSGSQTILHSKRLTTTSMAQIGEEKIKGTPAEKELSILMLFLLPFGASVLVFSIFTFFYCRMKHFILFLFI